MFVGSLGAALGLYAAAFIALDNDIDPFMRARVNGRRGPAPQPALLSFSRPSSAYSNFENAGPGDSRCGNAHRR
jgi:hypothetical protein